MDVGRNQNLKPARRLDGNLSRGEGVEFFYNGMPVTAYEGETIATALIAAGYWTFQKTPKKLQPRGVYCNIGICHSCLVVVDGERNVRACQTPVSSGCQVEMQVDAQRGPDETV